LSDEVKSVLAVVFKCKIFNAYGATEAAGSSACSAAIDTRAGIVGGPLPCLGLILQEERCASRATQSSKATSATLQLIYRGWLHLGPIKHTSVPRERLRTV
jgi:long-subunit acyl-CoA synthetase (AMP-forming)